MALPVTIPNEFANATASIPLSQLDTNFNTLANAVNGISDGSETLANASVTVLTAGTVDINGGAIDGTTVGTSNAAAGSFTTLNTSGAVVFNDAGADVDFRVEGDTEANLLFVDASADAVGIRTNSLVASDVKFEVRDGIVAITDSTGGDCRLFMGGSTSPNHSKGQIRYSNADESLEFYANSAERMRIDSSGNVDLIQSANLTWRFAPASTIRGSISVDSGDVMYFRNGSGNTERARITSGGDFLVGKTSLDLNALGCELRGVGLGAFTRNNNPPIIVNRADNDGDLVLFMQGGVTEGTISVSGNTVSYNPFLGSHSGALADWSRSDIKIGTVMDTIDELLEYKVVVIDVQEEVPAKEAVLDEEGNEVEPAQEATTQTVQKRISYNGNGAVGSSATVEYEGEEYTGTIQHEREEPLSFNKHLKVKVNDTAASKAVFGVFVGWNNDINNDGGVYNDMLVGAVGNYVIRMAAGQEPQIGDLVEADGNGCAVVQDDDIIRTKTVAKVTSTIKQVTYDDGSFLVTCVLYCG